MKQLFLSDHEVTADLFPLTLTRSAADIRIGIFTIREKWQAYLSAPVQIVTSTEGNASNSEIVSANVIPTRDFAAHLLSRGNDTGEPNWHLAKILQKPWEVFGLNDWAIRDDFEILKQKLPTGNIPATVQAINPDNIIIEKGAVLSHCTLNASQGPIYIGKNAEVMEGSLIRGPFALCEGAIVKMGARIYGATTIGPYCTVGGEIKNSVMFGYSNKAHDGYLGDSVIGEWCNLGAGTSNSNVKNNAGEVAMWDVTKKEYRSTGLSKCGLIMGDFSRAAINTSFNTGSIVGVSANVFGVGLMPKYIPAFSWGVDGERYDIDRAIRDIDKWMNLKGHSLNREQQTRLKLIFDQN